MTRQHHRWTKSSVGIAALTIVASVGGPGARAENAASSGPPVRDVALGALANIARMGREGPYPDGRVGLSMSTTSCNVGNVDVEWHQPMDEDHPAIAMQLYREMNGRFEQIGVSWVKHGFFAQSASSCSPCKNPTDGTALGVGCSDTYSNGNNGDRFWLGPREEIDAYAGTWSCTGSFFSGGKPDCTDRRLSSGFDQVEHRLEVLDADLGLIGAEYVYEANYVVRDDDNKLNNTGSRLCIMEWSGATWIFSTPLENNDLLEGPAIQRWGEQKTWVPIGATDGDVVLAVETTDLGGGSWRYEYALYNVDSTREIRSFAVPLGGATPTDMFFHDWDADPSNDWPASVKPGAITWETDTFETDPEANALSWGLLFNFGFTAAAAPLDGSARMDVFRPGVPARGAPNTVLVLTRAPDEAVPIDGGVDDGSGVPPVLARLGTPAPNPTALGTTVSFALGREGAVSIVIHDALGRHVRSLVDSRRFSTGAHRTHWDGRNSAGVLVGTGVYFVRLMLDGDAVADRSITVTR